MDKRSRSLVPWPLGLAAGVLGSGFFVLTAQPPAPTVFTSAQAEAGRAAYENICGKCHTPSLLGRKGDPSELPPVSSLPANMQDLIKNYRGFIPPLAGAAFLNHWGSHTAAEFVKRVQEAVGGFPPEGTNDETSVNIAAYILQVNGAKAGSTPLTKSTDAIVNAMTQIR
jgi:hypothetical protein